MYKANIEEIAEKIGGPFHLTVLIQKRLKEMKKREKDHEKRKMDKANLIDLVCQEILEGKIRLEEDKTEYEEDVDIANLYQTPLDDDDLAIGKGNNDAGFSLNIDEQ